MDNPQRYFNERAWIDEIEKRHSVIRHSGYPYKIVKNEALDYTTIILEEIEKKEKKAEEKTHFENTLGYVPNIKMWENTFIRPDGSTEYTERFRLMWLNIVMQVKCREFITELLINLYKQGKKEIAEISQILGNKEGDKIEIPNTYGSILAEIWVYVHKDYIFFSFKIDIDQFKGGWFDSEIIYDHGKYGQFTINEKLLTTDLQEYLSWFSNNTFFNF